jgi:hypothetical protein
MKASKGALQPATSVQRNAFIIMVQQRSWPLHAWCVVPCDVLCCTPPVVAHL